MTSRERRHEQGRVEDYTAVGFSEPEAQLLHQKILDRRKPWRREVVYGTALSILVASGIGVLSLINNSERIDDNKAAIEQVTQSREDAIRSTCKDTNERHDNTVTALRALSDQQLSPAEVVTALIAAGFTEPQAQVIVTLRGDPKQQFKSTLALINALAPKLDCQKRVEELTQ